MRIDTLRNIRDNDGTAYLLLSAETQAELCQLEMVEKNLRQHGISIEPSGLNRLKIRVLHCEAGRVGGPPLKISENNLDGGSKRPQDYVL